MSGPDRVGLTLMAALFTWTAATGLPRAPAATTWVLLLLVGLTVVWMAARRWAARTRTPASLPLAVAGAALALTAVLPGALSGGAAAPPLGYGNANGALMLIAAGAAVLAGIATTDPVLRRRCLLLVPVAVVFAVLTFSRAAAVLAVVVAASALLVHRPRAGRLLLAAALTLPLVTTAGTLAAALRPEVASATSSVLPIRPMLWTQAVDLVEQAPVAGTGPGGFAKLAPAAAADDDLRWAHSLLLQQAAETGWVGAGLLLALLGWVGAQLWRCARHDPAARVAGVLYGCLLTQAAVDYTAHVAVLALTTAAVLAPITATRRKPQTAR